MLSMPGQVRLFICGHPVSMRKSFEGLSALVEQLFPEELLSGAFFVFLNKRKDHMKVPNSLNFSYVLTVSAPTIVIRWLD